MTEKLFWQDPYQREFTASVRDQFPVGEAQAVVLDRTCFYATSGGQPNDLGSLNDAPVKDVRQEGDRILHLVDAPLTAGEVTGVIDWKRRFDHMQQHTGQHILSAAFFRLFQAETSSFHLGEEYCSIELNVPGLKETQVNEAEELGNRIVQAGTPVSAFFIDPEKSKEYPLRKQSDLAESLRLIRISDFDLSPCSGTHVKNAAEVGIIFVYAFERLPQTLKVSFLCGDRVHKRYRKELSILRTLSKNLTTSFELLPESVEKLISQLKEARKEITQLKEDRLRAESAELLERALDWNGNRLIVAVWDRPYSEARSLAQKLSTQSSTIGVLASVSENRVVFFKNPTVTVDLRPLFQQFLSKASAKGGGPPHFLEAGGFPSSFDLEALLRSMFQ